MLVEAVIFSLHIRQACLRSLAFCFLVAQVPTAVTAGFRSDWDYSPGVCRASLSKLKKAGILLASAAVMAGIPLGIIAKVNSAPAVSQTKNFNSVASTQVLDVAFVGDSLSRNFHISHSAEMLRENWFQFREDSVIDLDPSTNSIFSFYERIESSYSSIPLRVTTYASAASSVFPAPDARGPCLEACGNIKNFAKQVDGILNQRPFPNLILLWNGHNNMDWPRGLTESEIISPDAHLKNIRRQFQESYRVQLLKLIQQAKLEKRPVAIVVYGLIKFEATGAARQAARLIKEANPSLYPEFLRADENFPSVMSKYLQTTAKLSEEVNEDLRAMVEELKAAETSALISLTYSDAMWSDDFRDPKILNPIDGFHFSEFGADLAAKYQFEGAKPAVRFLLEFK